MFKLTDFGKLLYKKHELDNLKDDQLNIVRTLIDNDDKPIDYNPFDKNIKFLVRKNIVTWI